VMDSSETVIEIIDDVRLAGSWLSQD